MKFKLLLIYIAFIVSSLSIVQAQVTIGLEAKPRKGLLLDLKENEEIGKEANSEKGFGLPHVYLLSLNTLTIDDNSKGNDYFGTIVYNINPSLGEGTYSWHGDRWKRVILVDNPGTYGKVLISNTDYTYRWSDVTIPEYKFHKPTQTVAFDASKAQAKIYTFNQIVPNRTTGSTSYPGANIFQNDFVYTEILTPKSADSVEKYILLEITANIDKATVANASVANNFWEEIKIEILLQDNVIKTFTRNYSTPVNTRPNTTIDIFSIIPLKELNLRTGDYEVKVRISNTANSYYANYGAASGRFANTNQFLNIKIDNFGFILYEED